MAAMKFYDLLVRVILAEYAPAATLIDSQFKEPINFVIF